ncbi:MAG: sulfite exporter TauE/SafE family protein [Bacteroidota bacterium]
MILYALAVVGAFLAGCINTLAGNGSAITLTILMEVLGLPPDVANGTNRVGVLTQSLAGSWAFKREGKLRNAWNWPIIIWTSTGAVLGFVVSSMVSPESFRTIFRYLLVLMLVVILVNPKRWLRAADPNRPPLSPWLSIPLFFALGFYGGFIQMGMGVFFLATMVLVVRYDIIGGNVIKVLVVALYTAAAVIYYAYVGLIDWRIGGLMAIGQTTGGFLTATYASRYPQAGTLAYFLLILVVIGAILKAFWGGF